MKFRNGDSFLIHKHWNTVSYVTQYSHLKGGTFQVCLSCSWFFQTDEGSRCLSYHSAFKRGKGGSAAYLENEMLLTRKLVFLVWLWVNAKNSYLNTLNFYWWKSHFCRIAHDPCTKCTVRYALPLLQAKQWQKPLCLT